MVVHWNPVGDWDDFEEKKYILYPDYYHGRSNPITLLSQNVDYL